MVHFLNSFCRWQKCYRTSLLYPEKFALPSFLSPVARNSITYNLLISLELLRTKHHNLLEVTFFHSWRILNSGQQGKANNSITISFSQTLGKHLLHAHGNSTDLQVFLHRWHNHRPATDKSPPPNGSLATPGLFFCLAQNTAALLSQDLSQQDSFSL